MVADAAGARFVAMGDQALKGAFAGDVKRAGRIAEIKPIQRGPREVERVGRIENRVGPRPAEAREATDEHLDGLRLS